MGPEADIVGETADPFVKVLEADPVQPLPSVTVREYVAAVEVLIDCVAAPVDHR
jgi:hypothetical protein